MKTNGERKLMNGAIRGGSVGAMALAFVLCLASVGAADVPCCVARTRGDGLGAGVCAMVPTTDACASRGGRTAASCRACFNPAPMIQQPGAEDENGGTLSDGTDEPASSDLADVASDAVQQGSPWTLLVATMFFVGL
jgi:hypothetical protein